MNTKKLQELQKTFPSLSPLIGKKPIEDGWSKYCEEVRPFNSEDFKKRNAGLPCGPCNGIIVLDVDDVVKMNQWLKERGHTLPRTRTHLTGSGKPHYIYAYPNNGKKYGCRAIKDPKGDSIFDIKGIGGQVVAPGSIHPDTKKEYTVRLDIPITPAPEWLLNLAEHKERTEQEQPGGTWDGDLESIKISYAMKKLIQEGEAQGKRSEAIMSVLNALVSAGVSDQAIISIFEKYQIGEKYREKGNAREAWLLKQVDKVRQGGNTRGTIDVSARVREYLLDEFDGGTFKLSDLKRELGLDAKRYTVARNCIKRMVGRGEVEKHGHQLGCYRVIDRKKNEVTWDAVEAKQSQLILPGELHKIVTIRDGDMAGFAGYKNHNKTAVAIEIIRLNLDNFEIHFFITEYKARMKRRLLDFGIDLNHPNFHTYQIEKSHYIPDKIEPGEGVLNVIDHFPNLDNFYLVGKTQDEIHRGLNGALCIVTHQKKNPDDLDAIGGSFWTITPTLAVTLFQKDKTNNCRMQIRKGKEPGDGIYNANGLTMDYTLSRGCKFSYETGWE